MAAGSEQIARAMRALEAAFLIGVDGVTEVWLIRHADCYQGIVDTADPALSSLGREQAARLAKRVRRARPAAVYTSPFRRAVETAKAIGDEMQVDDRLVEMQLIVNEDGSMDPQEPPSGVIERMRAAIDEMVKRHPAQRVVAVSHGAAIMAYLGDVLRLQPGQLRMLPYFTSISIVRAFGERRMVGTLGDTAHLE